MGNSNKEPVKALECNEHHKHRFALGRDYPASALAGFIAGVLSTVIILGFALYFVEISNIQ
jgi:hypothetical protein